VKRIEKSTCSLAHIDELEVGGKTQLRPMSLTTSRRINIERDGQ